jgi:hypothetical protein
LVKVWGKRWSIWSLAYLGRKILNMPMLVRKKFFDYAYVSPENFLDLLSPPPPPPPPPPRRQHFREIFVRLGQNRGKCWSKHDDPPAPPQCWWLHDVPACIVEIDVTLINCSCWKPVVNCHWTVMNSHQLWAQSHFDEGWSWWERLLPARHYPVNSHELYFNSCSRLTGPWQLKKFQANSRLATAINSHPRFIGTVYC